MEGFLFFFRQSFTEDNRRDWEGEENCVSLAERAELAGLFTAQFHGAFSSGRCD